MGIKTVVFIVILAVVGYRVFKLVQFMKYNEAVFNHEPGPCRVVNIAKESCTNLHKDPTTCDDWAERGECKANRDWMKENCAKSCNFCEDLDTPILASEDFVNLGNGKVLISSGPITQQHLFPDIKGKILMLDLNKPNFGAVKVQLIWDHDKIEHFNPHGIGLWSSGTGKAFRMIIFVVNHDGGETVERFEYNEQQHKLTHIETITSPAFAHLNGVAPTGERTFYTTNSRYFSIPFLVILESLLMLQTGSVSYYDGSDVTSVASGYALANGIHISQDGKLLYVSSTVDMLIDTFHVLSDNSLQLEQTLVLNTPVDNIQIDPTTGDLWVAALAIPWEAVDYMSAPNNPDLHPHSMILRIKTKDGVPTRDIKQVFSHDGSLIKATSVAMTYNGHVLIGSIWHKALLCEIAYI